MGRFFSNLKQKTIAGSTAPTSAQLREAVRVDKQVASRAEAKSRGY